MKKVKILTTLGPSSLNKEIIQKLSQRGVDYFRINMSHTSIDELENHIDKIKKYSEVPICIDSEGAQVRTSTVPVNTAFADRQTIKLVSSVKVEKPNQIGLWPSEVFPQLKLGDIITIDFDSLLLVVTSVGNNKAEAIVLNGGSVGNNKAVTVFPSLKLPALSDKDVSAIKLGLKHGIKDFALSFANTAQDVKDLRKITGNDSRIISKIESKSGVNNLDKILNETDAILIDRGDLSREVPLENVPLLQKKIIAAAGRSNKDVYVATNLLESMMINSKPTRAEVNDVINTLIDGATGLVLAAETAIGLQPVKSVDMLRSLISRFNKSYPKYDISQLLEYDNLLLPKMHGSNSDSGYSSITINKSSELDCVEIDENIFLDVTQIAQGVYSPLKGFMNSSDLNSVLTEYRLSDGEIWTLPIIFQIDESLWKKLKVGSTVLLKSKNSPASKMAIEITELYKIDLEDVSIKWFGTNDISHPGVNRLFSLGQYVIAGDIIYEDYEEVLNSPYFLTPKQARMIFDIKGWSKIVAFHTRNVPHKAHEFIMNEAMNRTNADGLFIQPVIGPKKAGDFLSDVILESYDILIENYMKGALLASFSTYSRYSGPREAVFTALCRKNYGCTHFIIGRDHTGVGNFYKGIKNNELFNRVGDIGIEIVYFNQVGYSTDLNKIIELDDSSEAREIKSISGTDIRNALLNDEQIQEVFIRKEISDYLKFKKKNNEPLFVD